MSISRGDGPNNDLSLPGNRLLAVAKHANANPSYISKPQARELLGTLVLARRHLSKGKYAGCAELLKQAEAKVKVFTEER